MVNNLALTQLTEQIAELVRVHISSATPIALEDDLINDLGMDSLELVELNLKLEKQFGLQLPIAEIRRCVTLEDVIQLVAHASQVPSLTSAEHI